MNWIFTNLEDISESINTGFPSGKHNKNNIGIPHLRPMNISDKGEISLDDLKFVENDDHPTLLKGDILFNNTNSPKLLGKTGYIKENNDWFFSNHMTRIRLITNMTDSKFYAIYLHYLFYKGYYQANCQNHVNQASISKTVLSNVKIPLPPLAEQHRIVEKIEEEFTRLDAGVKALKHAKALIPKYRQSVLKAAMCGDLTKEWRALHPDVESAGVLVEKINNGKKSNSSKKPNYFLKNLEPPYLLPDKWQWTKIGNLSDLSSGIAFKRSEYSKEGLRLLQIANVTFGKIIWENKAFLPENYASKYPKLLLKEGDLLMALNRPILSNKLKIAMLSKEDTPAILYQRVGRFDLYFPQITRYLFYFLQSPQFIFKLEKELQGVDQPFINKPKLLDTLLPLPPLKEQHEIVSEIERRFSIIDEMERVVEESLLKAERLRQSVLKKAFEGRLVEQSPDDEPAGVLLERIQAEKELRAAEGKANGKKKSAGKKKVKKADAE